MSGGGLLSGTFDGNWNLRKKAHSEVPRVALLFAIVALTGCTAFFAPGSSPQPGQADSVRSEVSIEKEGYAGGCPEHLCKVIGLCVPQAGSPTWGCVVDDASCAKCLFCLESGQCWAKNGYCDAVSRPGQPCSTSCACAMSGRCAEQANGTCRASSDADCLASQQCKEQGLCVFYPDLGACSQVSEAGCLASGDCAKYGDCRVNRDLWSCEPRGDADCLASEMCALAGQCVWMLDSSLTAYCGKPRDLDCRATAACAKRGACSNSEHRHRCYPGSLADCVNSEECKTLGRCLFSDVGQKCYAPADVCHPGA